jgi:type IV secretion system protein VirB11
MKPLIKQALAPLEPYFKTKGLVEICINRPEEIWLEGQDGWTSKKDKSLTLEWFDNFSSIIATSAGQKYDEFTPVLSTHIPHYGYRLQVTGGDLVESKMSLSIRVGTSSLFPINSYMDEEQANRLIESVLSSKTILVAGGTSSGKTTFLNSLINIIPQDHRLIAIEDTKELIVPHRNFTRMLKSKSGTDLAGVTYKDIINCCVRMRPDNLLMGELDIDNTMPFLRIINTGHGGSLATVHADSTSGAIDAIVLNARLSGALGTDEDIRRYALKSIDIIVHLKRLTRAKYIATVEYINE